LPSSYRPLCLLDSGNLFEKILLTRFPRQVKERGLLRDEQFWFPPRHSTTVQLARLVERVNRIFDEGRLTGAVFLDVVKAFDIVWIKCLLYKLTILNFPSYLVKTISSYLDCRTFQTSFQSATSTCGMRWPRCTRLPCAVQSVCERHTYIVPSHRASSVRGRHGCRNHVLQSIALRRLSGGLSR
jgi:hypothetical protein